MSYQAADKRLFHIPDAAPAVPAALAGKLAGIVGLNNAVLAKPLFQRRPVIAVSLITKSNLALPENGIGSGVGGGLTPADIKTAYGLDRVPQTGAGRTLAVYELDGYTPADITQYENAYNLPQVPLQNILIGQADGSAGTGAGEVTLDIELMVALAPGAANILVYEGKNGTPDAVDTYNRIATDNLAKEISTSWGIAEDEADAATINSEAAIFQQMAAQGQSLYAAAGDSGAYSDGQSLSVLDPASQPFVTGVGGTSLATSGPGGAYQFETTWADPKGYAAQQTRGGRGRWNQPNLEPARLSGWR